MKKLNKQQVLTEKGVIKTAVRNSFNKELTDVILSRLEDLGIKTCERGLAIPLIEDTETGEVIINAVLEMVITTSDINKKYVRKSRSTKKEEKEDIGNLF